MQLPLGKDLLTSALNTCGSLAGRRKTPVKGYFPGNGPLLMQDVVVGGLFMKRKCSRETKPPILLRCGAEEQRPPRPSWPEPPRPPAACRQHCSAPTTPPKEQGQPPPPYRASKGCSTTCWTSWWSQQSHRFSLPSNPSAFPPSPLVFPLSRTFSPCLPGLPSHSILWLPHSTPAFWDTQATWFSPSLLITPIKFSPDPCRASSPLCFKEHPVHLSPSRHRGPIPFYHALHGEAEARIGLFKSPLCIHPFFSHQQSVAKVLQGCLSSQPHRLAEETTFPKLLLPLMDEGWALLQTSFSPACLQQRRKVLILYKTSWQHREGSKSDQNHFLCQ